MVFSCMCLGSLHFLFIVCYFWSWGGESNDQKKIWKEHMEILVNFENDWSDSIDANKVQLGELRLKRCGVQWIKWKLGKQVGPLGLLYNCLRLVGVSVWNFWQTYLMISCLRISYQRNGCWVCWYQVLKGKGISLIQTLTGE